MKVGVLGSGVVATTLGSGFLKHGHEVMLGTRSAQKLDDWKKQARAAASARSPRRRSSASRKRCARQAPRTSPASR